MGNDARRHAHGAALFAAQRRLVAIPASAIADEQAAELQEHIAGYCLVLRDLRVFDRDIATPPRELTAKQLGELASCDVIEGDDPELFAEMRTTIRACRNISGQFDPLMWLGMKMPAPTPDQQRALTACRNFLQWVEQEP